MKRNMSIVTALLGIFLVTVCFSGPALAQPGGEQNIRWWFIGTPLAGGGGGGAGDTGAAGAGELGGLTQMPIQTIQGTVVKLDDMRGVSGSEQMLVKTQQGDNWTVFLGPRWFVDNQRLKLNPGDQVEVKGGKVLWGGTSNIIAQDVSKGDMTMKLRNSDGLPSWECCFPRKPSTP